jgi:hypothetical protein
MIRTQEMAGIVPREQPDGLGLSEAMTRAADGGEAEAELQRQEEKRRATDERRLNKATRVLMLDAFYRAKVLNGDTGFDLADLDNIDIVNGIAKAIGERRRGRPGDA